MGLEIGDVVTINISHLPEYITQKLNGVTTGVIQYKLIDMNGNPFVAVKMDTNRELPLIIELIEQTVSKI